MKRHEEDSDLPNVGSPSAWVVFIVFNPEGLFQKHGHGTFQEHKRIGEQRRIDGVGVNIGIGDGIGGIGDGETESKKEDSQVKTWYYFFDRDTDVKKFGDKIMQAAIKESNRRGGAEVTDDDIRESEIVPVPTPPSPPTPSTPRPDPEDCKERVDLENERRTERMLVEKSEGEELELKHPTEFKKSTLPRKAPTKRRDAAFQVAPPAPVAAPTHKTCKGDCKALKPLSTFYEEKSGKFRRKSNCKACTTEKRKMGVGR
ncbi:hypothetical protein TrVE_jg13172 [Triparma verrucosa]|uniref:Uncharacterized protein n=1 Tax=Triparma verrucosa TaxID=1606542 RepID=A0A9W7BEC7_9STRA|nr:hypothetical protein TrVE_jg13172 [Triparma verrucosa]